MIAYIRGELVYKGEDTVVIDRDGMGFNIQVSAGLLQRLPQVGSTVKLFTYMNVKEDEISLFGFADEDELKLFNKLIKVSGVGPKSAAGLLGALNPRQLCTAIAAEDDKLISSGPGIGRKTAQKIILELRDKINTDDIFASADVPAAKADGSKNEAVQALESLGFTRAEAFGAVSQVDGEGLDSGEIISLALRALNR